MAIGHVVVFYARAAHAFSAGIKYWHCIIQSESFVSITGCTGSSYSSGREECIILLR